MIDLAHRIDVAQCLVDTARAHLAAAHDRRRDALEHGAAERYILQITTQVDGAEERLREQLDTLQALERERDATAAAEHADEVNADLSDLLADAIALHGAGAPEVVPTVARRLSERVAMMADALGSQWRVGMKVTHLSHGLDVARAALYVALERPEWIARLTLGLAPQGWERQTTPPVVQVPECMQGETAYGPAEESECVGGFELSEVSEVLDIVQGPPAADWSRAACEVIAVEAQVFGALRWLENAPHDPERWEDLGVLLDELDHPDVKAVCLERMAKARRAVGEVGEKDPLFGAMLWCSMASIAEDPEDWGDLPMPADTMHTPDGKEITEWPDASVTVHDPQMGGPVQSWPNMASVMGMSVRFEKLRAQDAADAMVTKLRGGER